MKSFPNATNSLSHSLFTFGRVCRLMLALVCLTLAASVCQAQGNYNGHKDKYDYVLDGDLEVANPNDLAQYLSSNNCFYLNTNGNQLTFNITDSQSITRDLSIKGQPIEDKINSVVKTGTGTLTLPSSATTSANFANSIDTLAVKQGELVLERNCIKVQNVIIGQNGTLTINNTMGGSYLSNLTGSGKLNANTTDSVGVILQNTADSKFDGIIAGSGNLRLRGNGNNNYTLTLTGANTNTGLISFDKSPANATGVLNLTLQDNAIVAKGPIEGCPGATVTYDVTSGERAITITGDTYVKNLKTIAKSGDGTLKIYSEAGDAVQAQGWVISSGRVDCAGYFGAFQDYGIVVESGATFSAGDTVGTYTTKQSGFSIKSLGVALFEFDSYKEDPSQQNFDTIIIEGGSNYTFTLEDGAIVELAFLGRDAESWAVEGAEYQLVKDPNFAVDKDYSSHLRGTGSNLFLLEGRKSVDGKPGGLFLVYNPNPVYPDVPEPSTWALLTLGVAGLIYWRKRKN